MVLFKHLRAIKQYGIREYIRRVWFLREFRDGELVGIDTYGNQYYELSINDPNLPFYRKRYVELANGSDDSSQVPAEWHGWLHYTNDDSPSQHPKAYPQPTWGALHRPNLTGSTERYVPYSTTDRKIHPWKPRQFDLKQVFAFENPALPDHPPVNPVIRDLQRLETDLKKGPIHKKLDIFLP